MDYDGSGFALLEARRAQLEAQRENSARRAQCSLTYTTTGTGEIMLTTPLRFTMRFTEEPCFTYGMVLDADTDLVKGHFPRASGGVHDWLTDSDLYVGAYLFFTVDTIGPGEVLGNEPNYKIHHHLRWDGMAIKDLPAHLLDF